VVLSPARTQLTNKESHLSIFTIPPAKPKIAFKAAPPQPLPILISVAASDSHIAYALSGPLEVQHRSAQMSVLGNADGLITACNQALRSLTAIRIATFAKAHAEYEAFHANPDGPTVAKPELKPVSVHLRTDSTALIEAAQYLTSQDASEQPEGIVHNFCQQLQRSDIEIVWTLLPVRAAEVEALERWAHLHCRPGRAAIHDGPTRGFYRTSFERLVRDVDEMDRSNCDETLDESADHELIAA